MIGSEHVEQVEPIADLACLDSLKHDEAVGKRQGGPIAVYEVTSCPYTSADRIGCLNVFDTNVPKFFAEDERAIFADFLDGPVLKRPYLVLRINDEVVACGGLKVLETGKSAFLSWGMVAQPYHGKGIGRVLTEARLHLARQTIGIKEVTLNTSQHTKGFYEKFGFVPVKLTRNAYGPNLDRWDMTLQLA